MLDRLNIKYKAGDVVLVRYDTFDHTTETGIFVVIHDGIYDTNAININIMGIKITSKQLANDYCVSLPKGMANLDLDSVVCCSTIHKLHKLNVMHTIGRLPDDKIVEIRDKVELFMNEILRQMEV